MEPLLVPYVRYPDLVKARIVTSWMALYRLIDDHGFPPGIMLSPNRRVWKLSDVEDGWRTGRPPARSWCRPLAGASGGAEP